MRHVRLAENGYLCYHFGIIDYLQKYNMKKRMENFGKGLINQGTREYISCVNPELYQRRFFNDISQNVIKSHKLPHSFLKELNS